MPLAPCSLILSQYHTDTPQEAPKQSDQVPHQHSICSAKTALTSLVQNLWFLFTPCLYGEIASQGLSSTARRGWKKVRRGWTHPEDIRLNLDVWVMFNIC